MNDPIDTTTAQGRLSFNLFASLAEFERELIAERTQAGLSVARARGRKGGRPRGLSEQAEITARAAETLYLERNSVYAKSVTSSVFPRPCCMCICATGVCQSVFINDIKRPDDYSMSVGFLTDADRERYNRFPEAIPHDDLVAYFLLSELDLKQVRRCREETTRLGFAQQLCALRFLGFVPDDLSRSPTDVIEFVADQLQLSPGSLLSYGQRPATRSAHFQQILRYLGFRKPSDDDLQQLS